MLTRRHIRIKVLQRLYAMEKNPSHNLNSEQKKLDESMQQMYRLYLLQMSMLIEIHRLAEHLIDVAQKKYLATFEERNPNTRFVQNKLLQQITQDQALLSDIENHHANLWYLDSEYVKIVYQNLTCSALYKTYMEKGNTSFEEDKTFVIQLFSDFIASNEKIYEYIEDHNLTWGDDFPWVNTFIVQQLKKANSQNSTNYYTPTLLKEGYKTFAQELLAKTALNSESFQQYISPNTPKWDTERIAIIDILIIKMAICEFLKFTSIPATVTINEYIEIAKEYSTSKSGIFINGILDKLIKEFREKKLTIK